MFYANLTDDQTQEKISDVIQPVWCDDFYQNDPSWDDFRNQSLICPNTTDISLEIGSNSIQHFTINVVSCKQANDYYVQEGKDWIDATYANDTQCAEENDDAKMNI